MDENLESDELVPCNPIEEKDKKIAALEKNLEILKAKEIEVNQLKKELFKSNQAHKLSQKKLSFTQKATEQRLLDCISNSDGFRADPALIGVYSATLDENEFEFGEVQEDEPTEVKGRRSRKEQFLKELEEQIDPSNNDHKVRFKDIKNQILEKVKATQASRTRSRSISNKRSLSPESKQSDAEKSPVRPRTQIPIKQ